MSKNVFDETIWGSFRRWRTREKVALTLAALVVFVTTYALILPAITAAKSPAELLRYELQQRLSAEQADVWTDEAIDCTAASMQEESDALVWMRELEESGRFVPLKQCVLSGDGSTEGGEVTGPEDAFIPQPGDVVFLRKKIDPATGTDDPDSMDPAEFAADSADGSNADESDLEESQSADPEDGTESGQESAPPSDEQPILDNSAAATAVTVGVVVSVRPEAGMITDLELNADGEILECATDFDEAVLLEESGAAAGEALPEKTILGFARIMDESADTANPAAGSGTDPAQDSAGEAAEAQEDAGLANTGMENSGDTSAEAETAGAETGSDDAAEAETADTETAVDASAEAESAGRENDSAAADAAAGGREDVPVMHTPAEPQDSADFEENPDEKTIGGGMDRALGETFGEKQALSGRGETVTVQMLYGADAGIPDGAALQIREIEENSEEYSTYFEKAAELCAEEGSAAFEESGRLKVKFIDISILHKGKEIEPAAPVDVKINSSEWMDLTRFSGKDVNIIHFTDEQEQMLYGHIRSGSDSSASLSFCTDGFSVYGIAEIQSIPDLDNKSFGIINNKDTVSGIALMANTNGTGVSGRATTVRIEPVNRTDTVFVANNSSITMWTFHPVEGGDNQYYVSASINDEVKYLRITSSGIELVAPADADSSCIIGITAGTGNYAGKYRLTANGRTLSVSGSNFTTVSGTPNNDNVWMYFAELSNLNDDDFVVYTASKVSVSGELQEDGSIDYDVNNGDLVIVYTRIWNDDTKRYDYYTIDYDGMLVKAYESGDTISWVGSKVNTMLWEFTEYYYDDGTPNYYYELQNEYSGKYIAPQVSGDGFLSDNTIGINLNGRRNLQYFSTVLAWDDPYYDYAALKVRDMQLISAPLSRADTFYFAVMKPVETEDDLTTVETIDHKPFGITLKMQDYEDPHSYSNGYRSEQQVDVLGNTTYNQWTGSPGLLKKNLDENNDYPVVVENGRSLGELYDKAMEVNQQFLLSTYEETGYFEYDSTQNFAHLISEADDPWLGQLKPNGEPYEIGDFVIYDQLGTTDEGNKDTLKHGQFLPYNDLDPNKISTKYKNEMDIHAKPLSSLDPRKGEELYSIHYQAGKSAKDGCVDHFFGMEMEARFMQSESGLDAWGHDLIFEFSGDDDFWLYVDGMLVLDLGGIHSALDGSINFRTGKVVVNGRNTNLRTLYKEAYQEKNPNADTAEIEAWLDEIFKENEDGVKTVFKDYSGHTMRMFYMERGAGASNLHMRFNLAPYTEGEVLLEKEVSGVETVDPNMRFPFQIQYMDKERPDDGYVYVNDPSKVKDAQTGDPVEYRPSYTVNGVNYTNVFFLKPGQTVSIQLPDEETPYRITECGMDQAIYDQVSVNGETVSGSPTSASGIYNYQTDQTSVAACKKIIYDNHVSSSAQHTLTVTKKLWQDAEKQHPISAEQDSTGFKFRIYIGKDGNNYTVYNTGKYYVKDPAGHYCIYENGGFVSTGKTVFSDLSTVVPANEWKSEQEKATFYSSPGGAVDKIPSGYSIEIPGLMNGTAFFVEERDNEIPSGYELIDYTTEQTIPEGETANKGVVSADDRNVIVNNRHGYGLNVEKVWSDASFMDSHDPIYFAVYVRNANGSLALLRDSVRRLDGTNTSIRWFFPELQEGKTLNDYLVYEIELQADTYSVDENTGIVTLNDTVEPGRIEENGTITVGGKPNDQAYSENLVYTANYTRDLLTPQQIADKVNSRSDQVKNARPGIKLVKTDLEGNPLEGGKFSLERSGASNSKKNFVSDENGLIAVAYLIAGQEYILTETAAPYQHVALIDPLTIREDSNGHVYVNNSDTAGAGAFYEITQVENPSAENMPVITIKNRVFSLKAQKIDLVDPSKKIEGVTFELYREVTDYYTDNPMPDYTPMEGFEELVTNENGIIPQIDLDHLRPGNYYLREKDTPHGYEPMKYDIRLKISSSGTIEAEKAEYNSSQSKWIFSPLSASETKLETDTNGNVTIVIANKPLKGVQILKKIYGQPDAVLADTEFELYSNGQIDVDSMRPRENESPIASGRTDENGILYLGSLAEANAVYYLFETDTPDGYLALPAPVIISISESGSLSATLNHAPLEVQTIPATGSNVEIMQITIYNNPGVILPHTGGPGTVLFTLAGALLVIAAGLVLHQRRRITR